MFRQAGPVPTAILRRVSRDIADMRTLTRNRDRNVDPAIVEDTNTEAATMGIQSRSGRL